MAKNIKKVLKHQGRVLLKLSEKSV